MPIALTSERASKETREAIVAFSQDMMGRRTSAKRKKLIAEYLGHPVSTPMCLFLSQFGGAPTKSWWGEEVVICPQKQCSAGLMHRVRGGKRMSFLAGVLNDPLHGLPMVQTPENVTERWYNFFVSVEYRICNRCFTIRACNRGE